MTLITKVSSKPGAYEVNGIEVNLDNFKKKLSNKDAEQFENYLKCVEIERKRLC